MTAVRTSVALGALVAALACIPGALAAPDNDAFSTPRLLEGVEGSRNETNVAATKEPEEPNHAGDLGGASVWFAWTAPRSGVLLIDTCDTLALDTLLAVYTGTTVGALTAVEANDDACGEQSAIAVDVLKDTTYRIAVDGAGGASGAFTLWYGMRPVNDDFADAVAIDGSTGSTAGSTSLASHEPGEPEHAGEPGGGSVWYRWTAPRNGRLRLNTCIPGGDTLVAVYTGSGVAALTEVAAGDDGCGGGGLGSYLEVDAFTGTVYSIAVDSFGVDPVAFTLAWELGPLYPRNLSPPTLSGPAVENGVMTADPGTWLYASSFGFAWFHCPPDAVGTRTCTRIRRADGAQLTVPTEAFGRHIRVSVSAYGDGASAAAQSELSAAVGYGPPVNVTPPAISGIPEVGASLFSSEGRWELGSTPRTALTYLWLRCDAQGEACANLKGPGSDAVLQLSAAHLGATIRVVVTMTSAGGATSVTSLQTARIGPAPRYPRRRTCVVPRLVGKSVPAARKTLARSPCRFRLGVARRRVRSARRAGLIVSQRPAAGKRLASRGRVTVVLSSGRRR